MNAEDVFMAVAVTQPTEEQSEVRQRFVNELAQLCGRYLGTAQPAPVTSLVLLVQALSVAKLAGCDEPAIRVLWETAKHVEGRP